MKRRCISALLALALLLSLRISLPARAIETSGRCGTHITWSFDEATGALTLTGYGGTYDYEWTPGGGPWWELNGQIKSIRLPEGMTYVSHSMFENCVHVTEVTLPESIEQIGGEAFRGCTSLTGIVIPAGVSRIPSCAFAGCTSLRRVQLPEGVQEIGEEAFSGCTALAELTLPDSVEAIQTGAFDNSGLSVDPANWTGGLLYLGKWLIGAEKDVTDAQIRPGTAGIAHGAFADCGALKTVSIPDSVTRLGAGAFSGCGSLQSVVIPDSVKTIGSHAFSDCTALTDITIPGSAAYISDGAFSGCTALSSVRIPASVEAIWSEAFSGCTALETVTLQEGLKSIGDSAFKGCSSLRSVTIPAGTEEIGRWAFMGCSSLASIIIPEGMKLIGDYAFSDCTALTEITIPGSAALADGMVSGYTFSGCTALKSAVLSEGVPNVPAGVFSGCSSLVSVTIPDSAEYIGDSAFSGCSSLTDVRLPEHISSIGTEAFSGCVGLTSVTIPESVKWLGNGVFSGCTNLEEAPILGHPAAIPDGVFSGCASLKNVTIPDSVTKIGAQAFAGCAAVSSVTIPDSVTEIGNAAFAGCAGLTEISGAGGAESIAANAFSETGYYLDRSNWEDGLLYLGRALLRADTAFSGRCDIRADTTCICAGAFKDCAGLTGVTIPSGLKVIDDEVFSGCTGLTDVSFPEGLERIGDYAFMSTALTRITVPASVDAIGWGAFALCGPESLTVLNRSCRIVQVEYNDSFVDEDLTFGCASTVYGYRGSTAEQIAKEYGYRFKPIVNGPVPEAPCGGENCPGDVFTDMPSGWAHDPIDWAVENGITSGISDTAFGPNRGCTRGQVVTFLWRAAGCPEPATAKNPFRDVSSGAFYYKAVLWAVEEGVTNGTSSTTFSPDATCTRGQIVTFIWRANGSPKSVCLENPFRDAQKNGFYYRAMLWAAEHGVTTGVSADAFAPGATCTRAQVVAFLYRAAENDGPSTQFKLRDYWIYISDDTWDAALAHAESQSGKLLSIDSPEEFRFVLDLIAERGYEDVFFSLGGRRADDGDTYYWTDGTGRLVGEPLHGEGVWCDGYWEPGEPSLVYKDRQETVLMMYYNADEGRWMWYDGDDAYRSESRTYGYIIEFDGSAS